MGWSMLSTPKSFGYPPRSYLSAKLPRVGHPQNSWVTIQPLTFLSLIFGIFGHSLSQVTLWSWNLQGETQGQDH